VNPDFVRNVGVGVVVKGPAAALAVNEMAERVVLIGPQPCDPAGLAMRATAAHRSGRWYRAARR